MPKVILQPINRTIEVSSDEDLMAQIKESGTNINSSCGGCASCSKCIVKIVEGEGNITPITFEEKQLLGNVFHITQERLSCQTKVLGNITIDISNHLEDTLTPNASDKTSNVRIRKKEMLEKEKEEDVTGQEAEVPDNKTTAQKKLGGRKRPKPFKFDNTDIDKDQEDN